MKSPIRNETSLTLAVAVVVSAVAVPVLSGLLEPSPPPAVAAGQIGDPRDQSTTDDGAAAGTSETNPAPGA